MNIDAQLIAIANSVTLEESKKKKKPYDSVTYTTGDPDLNIAHFNKMLSGKEDSNHTSGYLNGTFKHDNDAATAAAKAVGTFAAPSPDGASSVSLGGDAGSSSGGEGGAMGESLELDEDAIYISRLGIESELPPEIKLLDQANIEQLVDKLEPEQEFTVGYVSAIFFYKELWEKMPIYKCTEFKGYTGIDFEGSKDIYYTDKQARINRANDEIAKAKASGQTFQVGSDVEYSMQNKLVDRGQVDRQGKLEQKNTILFYPTSAPEVCYFVKLPGKDHFIKINTEQLQTYIYDMLDKIKLKVTPEQAKARIHTSLYGQTDKDIDKQTQAGKEIGQKYIYKYSTDKPGVRALYTNQIYYVEVNGHSVGHKIANTVTESLELDETKRYVRRYYMKPQNIPLSNKDEVLKALIDHEDEDCVIYTLNNLGDTKDFNKLTDNDIIYYYEDGILYDKNHVRIMDYELSIKKEEERAHINPETTSDAKFAQVYQDRMTGITDLEEAFDLSFDSYNVYGEKLTEGAEEHVCCICKDKFVGYGNNPEPYMSAENGEVCCDACNAHFVIPKRLELAMSAKEEK